MGKMRYALEEIINFVGVVITIFVVFMMVSIPLWIGIACFAAILISGIDGPIFWVLVSLLSLLMILSIGSIKDFFFN